MLVARLRKDGARGNLELSFEAPMREIESAWREQLDEMLYPGGEPDLRGIELKLPTHERRDLTAE